MKTTLEPLPFGDPCRNVCDISRIKAYGIIKSFYDKYNMVAISLVLVSLVGPFNSILSPLFIGKLSDGISKHNVKKTSIYISLLVFMNIFVLVLYNLDLYTTQNMSCKLASHIQEELLEFYFDTHESGTASTLDDNVTRNVQIFIESMIEFVDITRNIIGPSLFSLLLQSLFLFAYVDLLLGLCIFGIFVIMVISIYISSNKRSLESKRAVQSDISSYGYIEDILDNFINVVVSKTAQYKELKNIEESGKQKCIFKLRQTVKIIKFVATVSIFIIFFSMLFGVRFYWLFIRPYQGAKTDEEKENVIISNNIVPFKSAKLTNGNLTEKAVSAVSVFFGTLSGVRSMLYYVYYLGDASERIRTTTESLMEGSICDTGKGCDSNCDWTNPLDPFPGCDGNDDDEESGNTSVQNVKFSAQLHTVDNGASITDVENFAVEFDNVTFAINTKSSGGNLDTEKGNQEKDFEERTNKLLNVNNNSSSACRIDVPWNLRYEQMSANEIQEGFYKNSNGELPIHIENEDFMNSKIGMENSAPKKKQTGSTITTKKIFNNLSFGIPKNSRTAIIGRNGCGKTTVFNIIMMFKQPNSGVVRVNGSDVNEKGPRDTRAQIAYSNQFASLFDRSVLENLIYPETITTVQREKVWNKIREYKLESVYRQFENGLDTRAGRRGERLSGGQRQIVQLTKILLKGLGNLILLDEVTASVDVYHRRVIIDLLKSKFFRDKTVIFITHDPELLEISTHKLDLGNLSRIE